MADNGPVRIRYAVGSDPGLHRQENEDSVYTSSRLLAVADGMGGHVHGEIASSAAITAMAALDESLGSADPDPAAEQAGSGPEDNESVPDIDPRAALSGGVADAGRRLDELVGRDPSLQGMGTTLTAMLWIGDRFTLAHIGDSRAYLLRTDELQQLTTDHTFVQALVDEGRMLPEQAAEHPRRSMLTRALQGGSSAEPDVTLHDAWPGDRYLLCSDGLTDVVSFDELRGALCARTDPDVVVRELINLANRGGGPDNISCVVVDVEAIQEGAVQGGTTAAE
ncbi:MAG: serine/threonine-protein phosphatase [Pseudonocardiaceae bacterium]|nr:serine/threonine-protein phosphatase [Pseudonocardiaceae bacterium]